MPTIASLTILAHIGGFISYVYHLFETELKGFMGGVQADVDTSGLRPYSFVRPTEPNVECVGVSIHVDAQRLMQEYQEHADRLLSIQEELALTSSNKPDFSVIVLNLGDSIRGVTAIGDRIFVVTVDQPRVRVIDYKTRVALESDDIEIPDLSMPQDLVKCVEHNALYISDWGQQKIHKVSIEYDSARDGKRVTSWPVKNGSPGRLSITANNTLLLIVHSSPDIDPLQEIATKKRCISAKEKSDEYHITEYSFDGNIIRDIPIDERIKYPLQAVQLSDNELIICSEKVRQNPGTICTINAEGKLIKSYVEENKYLCSPQAIATNVEMKDVFVCDNEPHGVLLFDLMTLEFRGKVHIKRGFKCPTRIFFDSSTGRLYVGEYSSCLVILSSTL